MGVMPTTSRVVSSMKPFLLGFVLAITLIGAASMSSIHVICKEYRPVNAKGPCSLKTTVVETKGNPKNDMHWRSTVPFLSVFAPRKKKQDRSKTAKPEIIVPGEQPPSVPKECLCRVLWESLGYRSEKQQNTCEVEIVPEEDKSSDRSKALEAFPTAFTPERVLLTGDQEKLVRSMKENVLEAVPNFEQRSSLVPWGGPSQAVAPLSFDWFDVKTIKHGVVAPLDKIEGGNLFSSYLRIMKWPKNLGETDFPFKLCKAKKKNEGKYCDATVAIQHTLEFRERYMPWLVTHGIKRANSNGLVYHRGFSPPHSEEDTGGHAIVWMRLACKVKSDNESERVFFVRSMIREFDRAVAASLQRSNGRLGKFNTVIDGTGFTWSSMPSLSAVKTLVAILQDHFADRLGVVILTNMGSVSELLLKLFLPLITEEVRNKILVLPHDPQQRMEQLEIVLGKENIPAWLGGIDDFEFQVDEYYSNDALGADEKALEYVTTMPYHA